MVSKRLTGKFGASLAVLVVLSGLFWATGCANRTRNVLFNTPRKYYRMGLAVVHLNPDSVGTPDNYQHHIQPDDRIAIRFLNNFDISEGVTITAQSSSTGISFLVDKEGFVNLPMLGRVKVVTLTTQECARMLEEKYRGPYKDPSLEVAILNLSVSVTGMVGSPGIYQLLREKTSLLEVLSNAGGITQYGKKSVVKVVRNVAADTDPEVLVFDLRRLESIETKDLILRDKDVIYVEPRDIRVLADAIQPYTNFITLSSTVATITLVILNATRRP